MLWSDENNPFPVAGVAGKCPTVSVATFDVVIRRSWIFILQVRKALVSFVVLNHMLQLYFVVD